MFDVELLFWRKSLGALVALTLECLMQAAALQQVPPAILVGILRVEGGQVGLESPNRNGSFDLGPMQVNDRVWVPVVARAHFGGDQLRARQALRDHGCYNMHVGAWIYRRALDRSGGNHAEAVGRYHSTTPGPKQRYQDRVARALGELMTQVQAAPSAPGEEKTNGKR